MALQSDTKARDARAEPRSSMFLAAVMRAGSEQAPVKVRNMSAHGAMIESAIAPSAGTRVDLIRGALVAHATVIWASGSRFGLRFSSEVSTKDWLAAPAQVQQQRVDAMVELVKAGAADPEMNRVMAPRASSPEQLADDLTDIIRLMQDLEDDLASSDETLERHGMRLQNLDIAMQMLRAISGELKPGVDGTSAGVARLDNLRVACAQALAAGCH